MSLQKTVHHSLLFFLLVAFTQCIVVPFKAFKEKKTPSPPDYSNPDHWAALPAKKDSADFYLNGHPLVDNQKNAEADVFFIHPTSYRVGKRWNAKIDQKKANRRTDRLSMRMQASAFNASCKVYAPRYRQAALVTYIEKKGVAPKVFDVAYQDVKKAFLYYLEHYNNGRPFIIAAHSQGTDHAARLLNDLFSDPRLKQQLVAAYLVGRPIYKDSLKFVQPCDSGSQTGCFVTWNAVPWGVKTLFGIDPNNLEFTNPMSWKRDTAYVPAKLNSGSLPLQCVKADVGLFDAKVTENGLLWVHRPDGVNGKQYLYIESESFHVIEYNLFYMSIRENAKLRVNTYLKNFKK
jgi:hypothetical protein